MQNDFRQTKITATLGPVTESKEMITNVLAYDKVVDTLQLRQVE